MNKIFSERLRTLRKEHHLSQIELAKAIDVGSGVIGDLERGQRAPSRRVAGKLAAFFDTEIDFWLDVNAELKKLEKEKKFTFLNESLMALKKSGRIKNFNDLREEKNLEMILKLIAYELELDEDSE